MLNWLEGQPGGTWQERWAASGAAEAGAGWREAAAAWLEESGLLPACDRRWAGALGAGLTLMICGDLHGHALLPAAADIRGAPARGPGQRPDVQLTAEELIGQYGIECAPVRDLLVSYLRERHLAGDYSTLRTIAHMLGRLFWRDLELHHPGIGSLRLAPDRRPPGHPHRP